MGILWRHYSIEHRPREGIRVNTMNIQVSDHVWLKGSVDSNEICVWSGETIDGPYLVITGKKSEEGRLYPAYLSLENVMDVANALENYEVDEETVEYNIGRFVGYTDTENSAAPNLKYCDFCDEAFEDDPNSYWLGSVRIHVSCADKLVKTLKDDVWEYSDEIVQEKLGNSLD